MSTNSTIASAIHFLLKSQHKNGWWEDFQLAPGSSNVWVTAYIGRILALQDSAEAQQAAMRAWSWLSEQESQGWGYNLLTPHDADSTIWALQLAKSVGAIQSKSAKSGYNFLRQHLKTDGGIATYVSDREIRAFIGAPPFLPFDGWCQPQICVTAAAGRIDQFTTEVCNFLRDRQSIDGHWRSYWWCEDEYATNLAVIALKKQNNQENTERIERAINWALTRIKENGSVSSSVRPSGSYFATALVISLLSMSKKQEIIKPVMERAIEWLKAQQKTNGSWSASAGLRVPLPHMQDPENYDHWEIGKQIEGGISLDQNGLFTTATVIEALTRQQKGRHLNSLSNQPIRSLCN